MFHILCKHINSDICRCCFLQLCFSVPTDRNAWCGTGCDICSTADIVSSSASDSLLIVHETVLISDSRGTTSALGYPAINSCLSRSILNRRKSRHSFLRSEPEEHIPALIVLSDPVCLLIRGIYSDRRALTVLFRMP